LGYQRPRQKSDGLAFAAIAVSRAGVSFCPPAAPARFGDFLESLAGTFQDRVALGDLLPSTDRGIVEAYRLRRLPAGVTRENDVVVIYEQRIGKSKLLDALLQPADLLCRMRSYGVKMTL
jgi:hypothetical protein